MKPSPFKDREEAGRILAETIHHSTFVNLSPSLTLILAIPGGGVPVAIEVARRLDLPMNVIEMREGSVLAPPESTFSVVPEFLDLPLGDLRGRTVLLIDDGLATGATSIAAARLARNQGAARVVLAVPVAAAEVAKLLLTRDELDAVIAIHSVPRINSLSQWYETSEMSKQVDEFGKVQKKSQRASLSALFDAKLRAELSIPENPVGLVIFAHACGSSNLKTGSREIARILNYSRIATLPLDLLLPEEANDDALLLDIDLLSDRLLSATRWVQQQAPFFDLPLGYFGASAGAAAALVAAAELGSQVTAIVSQSGRSDLARSYLSDVTAPTQLLVGSLEVEILELNKAAAELIPRARLAVITDSKDPAEEPNTLAAIADETARFFEDEFERHFRERGTRRHA